MQLTQLNFLKTDSNKDNTYHHASKYIKNFIYFTTKDHYNMRLVAFGLVVLVLILCSFSCTLQQRIKSKV